MSLKGSLTGTGPFDAQIAFVEPVTYVSSPFADDVDAEKVWVAASLGRVTTLLRSLFQPVSEL